MKNKQQNGQFFLGNPQFVFLSRKEMAVVSTRKVDTSRKICQHVARNVYFQVISI